MLFSRVVSGLAFAVALVAMGVLPACAEKQHPTLGKDETAAGEAATELADEAIEETLHGKPKAHGGSNENPLEFKKDLAIWTGVVFLILMAVLWVCAWKPIAKGLDKREKGIADQIDQADRANQQAQQLLGQYEQKLNDAKDEVRQIIDQGRRDAEQVGLELVDKAKQEADTERQRALQDIDTATAGALKELAEKSADLAVGLAGKIVEAELKPADHARLIEQAMSDFGGQSPSSN